MLSQQSQQPNLELDMSREIELRQTELEPIGGVYPEEFDIDSELDQEEDKEELSIRDPFRYVTDKAYEIQAEVNGKKEVIGRIEVTRTRIKAARDNRVRIGSVFNTDALMTFFSELAKKKRTIENMLIIFTAKKYHDSMTDEEMKDAIDWVINDNLEGNTAAAMCTYIPNTFPHISTEDEKADFMKNIGFKYFKDPGLIAGKVFWKQAD